MWLLTPIGFFSIVRKPGDEAAQTLTVRSRVHADLERLRKDWLPELGPVVENAGTDYRYRARVPREALAGAMSRMVLALDYSNFKNEVARRQGKLRASVYGEVWEVLYELPDETLPPAAGAASPAPVQTSGKKIAYGGVLVNGAGELLLREPRGHYDGYVWTFPKGRPDPGESPAQAALREVLEETGYGAEIIDKIPGQFPGGTTVNEFFLMRPIGTQGDFGADETQAVTWASPEQAAALIGKTTNATGRVRDLQVLAAAMALLSP